MGAFSETGNYLKEFEEGFGRLNVQSGRCLEIGCGVSPYVSMIKQSGMVYEGCDSSVFACRWMRETHHVRIHQGKFENIRFHDLYDVILAAHVLEHVRNADIVIQKIFQLLRPGGSLYLLIPDDSDLHNQDHFWFFTEKSAIQLMNSTGFTVESAVTKKNRRSRIIHVLQGKETIVKAIPSPEIYDRSEFSLLCNWRKLYRAVEVGVDRAAFAEEFMSRWRGHNYFGIDTYSSYPEFPWSRETDYLMAVARFERSKINCKLIKADSVEAANSLKQYNGQYFADLRLIDFVYIDAGHDYDSVRKDLAAWWPLVSEIGVLAGHDYDASHPEVVRAVDDFFAGTAIVYRTHEPISSWYVYRNGIPGSDWRRVRD